MPFIELDKQEARREGGDPTITFQKGGRNLTWSPTAHELIGEPEYVALLYDPDARRIGIKPVDADYPNAYKVVAQRNGNHHMASSRIFARHFGLDTSVGRRYPATVDEGMLVANLDEGVEVRRGPRGLG